MRGKRWEGKVVTTADVVSPACGLLYLKVERGREDRAGRWTSETMGVISFGWERCSRTSLGSFCGLAVALPLCASLWPEGARRRQALVAPTGPPSWAGVRQAPREGIPVSGGPCRTQGPGPPAVLRAPLPSRALSASWWRRSELTASAQDAQVPSRLFFTLS